MEATKLDILAYLASQKESFKVQFQVTKLGLFGSYATDNAESHSDIDVIIEFEPQTTHLRDKKEKIRSLINSRFNKDVDLCREKYIKPYFREHILNSVIYV